MPSAVKDVAGRLTVTVQSFKDVAGRLVVLARSFKDVGARARFLSAIPTKDVGSRFWLAIPFRDVRVRLMLRVRSYDDTNTRFTMRILDSGSVLSRVRIVSGAQWPPL